MIAQPPPPFSVGGALAVPTRLTPDASGVLGTINTAEWLPALVGAYFSVTAHVAPDVMVVESQALLTIVKNDELVPVIEALPDTVTVLVVAFVQVTVLVTVPPDVTLPKLTGEASVTKLNCTANAALSIPAPQLLFNAQSLVAIPATKVGNAVTEVGAVNIDLTCAGVKAGLRDNISAAAADT